MKSKESCQFEIFLAVSVNPLIRDGYLSSHGLTILFLMKFLLKFKLLLVSSLQYLYPILIEKWKISLLKILLQKEMNI